MSTFTVLTKNYTLPQIDKGEVLRFMGCKSENSEINSLFSRVEKELPDKSFGKVCYSIFPIKKYDDYLDLGFAKPNSQDLARNLDGCDSIILFAATVGIEYDKLILKLGKSSPAEALCIDAIGNERIEALCDIFCNDIEGELLKSSHALRPRFSAGYGDLPIELQKDIFNTLSPHTKIGLTLNDSLLMSPTKSVSAIVGIKKQQV